MQKNSGNKGAKRSGAGEKSRREIAKIFDFLHKEDDNVLPKGIHIAKVIHKFGNGRVEVFYVEKEVETFEGNDGGTIEKEQTRTYEKQAIIRGTFRGRGKREVWIDIGTNVVVQENLDILEVIAVLSRDQLRQLSDQIFIDKRVLATEGTSQNGAYIEDTIEFANSDTEEPLTTSSNVVDKRNKHKHERQNVPSDDINVDDI